MSQKMTAKEYGSSFAVANVYIGALVGPALVAGTYAVVFYLPAGANGLWLPFIAMAIVGAMCAFGAEIIRHVKKYDYGSLAKEVYFNKKFFLVIFDIYILMANIVGAALVQSLSGTFMKELFGMPEWVGMAIIAVISLVLLRYKDGMIRIANSIMSVVMLVGFVIISVLVIILFGDKLAYMISNWVVPETANPAGIVKNILSFAFASAGFALTMCVVEQPIKKKKQSIWIGLFIVIVAGVMMALSCFSFLPFQGEIEGNAAPLVYVMNTYIAGSYPWLPIVYYIIMLMAIVSSMIPGAYMVATRWEKTMPSKGFFQTTDRKIMLIAVIYMIICTTISLAGASNIASTGLTIVGYVGMPVVVIPVCFIWPVILYKRRKKAREEGHPIDTGEE